MGKYIFFVLLLSLVIMSWHSAVAQTTSLPACTAAIDDTDSDSVLDNDGVGGTIDIDKDGDGLIEVCDLEGIDEMRYQMDGSGYAMSTSSEKITAGCPDDGCIGYELVQSLDFADAGSYRNGVINTAWTTGAGWQPIGSFTNPFSGTFVADIANNADITISNLMINRPDEDFVGLFGATDNSNGSWILGIRLLAVDIKGRFLVGGIAGLTGGGILLANSSVEGNVEGSDAWIGGLVGANYGSIINGYAKGTVKGHTSIGGLAGYSFGPISNSYASVDVEAKAYSGGLVGYNHNRVDFGGSGGRITNSYATGSVQSGLGVGGLVGYNERGIITDVYASGDVTGSAEVGGLVGYNDAEGSIRNGYALGVVSGGVDAGGLVGYNTTDSTISNSYWDVEASGIKTSAGGTSKTTAELQAAPASDLYIDWSMENWEFGSASTLTYPTLKYTEGNYNFGEDGRPNDIYGYATCGANVFLPDCGTILPDQGQPGNQGQLALKTLTLSVGVLEPPFDPMKTYYEILDIPAGQTDVTVTATANNDRAAITIGEQSFSPATLQLDTIGATALTGINIVLTAMEQSTKHYTIVLLAQPLLSGVATAPCSEDDIDKDDDGLIEVCDLEGLYAIRYQLDGSGYTTSTNANKITTGCAADGTMQCSGYELVRNLDFNNATHYRNSRNQAIWTVADDTDMADRGWRPIGSSTKPFDAVFKGNGYTISNLAINRDDSDYVGLFGKTTSGSEIAAIGLSDVTVHGRFVVGGLVGWNNGDTIEHSYVSGEVLGYDMLVGGLVGSHRGRINNSYAMGMVSGNRSVGGLVGASYRTDRNSTSTIINSYALSDVDGRTFVGGLVGGNLELVSNSYAGGMVEGIWVVGGLVGLNQSGLHPSSGLIVNTYADGNVSGSYNVGGLVGENRMRVENSYASGVVRGYSFVGGLVGRNAGSVVAGYWDQEASGVNTSDGSPDENGLATNELQASDLFEGWLSEHWDFTTGHYPVLKYIVGDDDAHPACDDGTSTGDNTDLPSCATALPDQLPSLVLTGLPACTAAIGDTDGDSVLDNDGVGGTIDIDKDGDGLIEVCDLEGIDEMRYQMDGSGYAMSTSSEKITAGCPDDGCIGYELVRSLDFADAGSYRSGVINTAWTTGVGWQPIGSFTNPFSGTFVADIANNADITISNLMINRPDEDFVGLFGATDNSNGSWILGIRLLAVDIKGRFLVGGIAGLTGGGILLANSSVEGNVEGSDAWIGGLVGANYGSIINGYAKGAVKGHTSIGGLAGYSFGPISNSYASVDVEAKAYSGGLVGYNHNRVDFGGSGGRITNSYATGSVQSGLGVGGLVGYNERGIITDVYASGDVTGSAEVGGLVGYNDAGGSIRNGYALGVVSGGVDAGGLVGYNTTDSTISNSYWDVEASGIKTSAGGTSKTTAALQAAPASDLYIDWSMENWEFGSASTLTYPTLKYTEGNYNFGEDGRPNDIYGYATCGANVFLPDCGTILPDQGQPGNQGQLALKTLTLSVGVLEPPFDPMKTYYEILDIPAGQTDVIVTATANNDRAAITIGERSFSPATLQLDTIGATALTGINIVLTAMEQSTKHYTIVLLAQPLLSGVATAPCSEDDIDKDDDGLIEVCDLEGLYAIRYQLDGSGYTTSTNANKITTGCAADGTMQCSGYELVRNLDFNNATHYRNSRNQAIWTVADDTDMADRGWRPIGSSTKPFDAVFKGNGYTISNLAINRDDSDYVGLFGKTTSGSEIAAIGLSDVTVHGRFVVGGLVGWNNGGTIEHSYVSGEVLGYDMLVGGLVGSHRGRINNSYAMGMVSGNRSVGGLVGASYRTDRNSTSTIINSYALSDVDGRTFVGGLVGGNLELVSNSYAGGMVEGIWVVGGLVGLNQSGLHPSSGLIVNTYADGNVSGSYNVGGLVGENRMRVENSYASGVVRGYSFVGGLVGRNAGSVVAGYWDQEASGVNTSDGSPDENGLATNELQASDLFEGWSSEHWDFTTGHYPVLKYIVGDDDAHPACDDGTSTGDNTDLPSCATVLSGQLPPFVLTGLPACTAAIDDTDSDSVLDNDGVGGTIDIDKDGDGLIEVCDLEGIDEMRYQMDGSGYAMSTSSEKITAGCPDDGCIGYELVQSLDFADAGSYRSGVINTAWTTGAGWQPIGSFTNPFSGTFVADIANNADITISNLMINRPDEDFVGLFGATDNSNGSWILGIRLLAVDIKGRFLVGGIAGLTGGGILLANSSVEGNVEGSDAWIGGLVGANYGSIINGYAKGAVKGHTSIGGLAGYSFGPISNSYASVDVEAKAYSGGLVGYNHNRVDFGGSGGRITNSYATGSVQSGLGVGGLVGYNERGIITDVYASGDVTGSAEVGGLVGYNDAEGSIRNGYALGVVSGGVDAGGLVGYNTTDSTISNSYWDVEASGIKTSAGGTSKTTAELQAAPASDLYIDWSMENWEFGSASTLTYPTLKYTEGNYNFGEDGRPNDIYGYATCGANVFLPDCGTILPDQGQPGNQGQLALKTLTLSVGVLEPPFDPMKTYYEILDIPAGQTDVTVTATANNDRAAITIGEQSFSPATLQLDTIGATALTGINIVLTAMEQSTKHYTIVLLAQPLLSGVATAPCSEDDIDKDDDGLIEVCDLEGLYAIRYQLDGSGYTTSTNANKITTGCAADGTMQCSGYELVRNLDFNNATHYRNSRNQAIWTVADDTDMADRGWRPIGSSTKPFDAVFKGNGYTISNLAINRDDSDYVGLFGKTTSGSEIAAIGLSDVTVHGRFVVGGLVGWNNGGTIEHSYVSGEVLGYDMLVGGLVGSHRGRINNSYAMGMVSGNRSVGGLVGASYRTDRNSTSTIINSYALSDVDGRTFVGGLVGGNLELVSNSYAGGMVEGIWVVGGLVGLNQSGLHPSSGLIVNTYADGNVSGSYNVGGLVGENRMRVENSYASGVVRGYSFVGGLVGRNAGSVVAGYWDQEASGVNTSDGSPDENGLATNELQASDLFEGWLSEHWDFTTGHYPVLKYIVGDDDAHPACDDGTSTGDNTDLPSCATALPDQLPSLVLTGLPACTAAIGDTDGDSVLDNDGVGGTIDIDKDGDGLIEVCDLEGIDEMRYQMDGSGYAMSTSSEKITAGCPDDGCIGYELVRSLDFADAGSYRSGVINTAWTTGVGWQPIGSFTNPFSGTFVADIANNADITISNLMINRPDEDFVGLFGATDNSNGSWILGIRLLAVDIKGRFLVGGIAGLTGGGILLANSSVEGNVEGSDAWIGGLVGANYGSIINGYAKGTVKGHTSIGGLAGYSFGPISNSYASVDVEAKAYSGGLVGYNHNQVDFGGSGGRITNSYATGSVQSGLGVGGLVGYNERGIITDVYASGDVTGSAEVGGLVGYNDAGGSIRNGYALGVISGGVDVGGLVGYNTTDSTISNSYWDVEASGIKTSAGGTSKTTAALQAAPASDLYIDWSMENWEFGSESTLTYPTLKYTEGNYNFGEDGRPNDIYGYATCGANVFLPDCGTILPDQGQPGNQGQLALKTLTLSIGVLEPPFDPMKTYYEILDIPAGQTDVIVTATANNDRAAITIGEQSFSPATLQLDAIGATAPTGINIVLTAMEQSTRHYTIVLPAQPLLSGVAAAPCSEDDIDKDDDGLIEVCDLEGLYAIRYQLDGSGYTISTNANKITTGCAADGTMQCSGYELMRNLDFNNATHYRNSRNQAIWTVADDTNMADRGWRPIGSSTKPFDAVFKGNGYTISNLAINRDDSDYVGLFGKITSGSEIAAIGLSDVTVHGRFLVGGLAGWNNGGTIEHSYVSGEVLGHDMLVGGLVGSHRGRINNSYAMGMVSGNRSVGGLVGASYRTDHNSTSTIINSYALSDVDGRTFVGGLVGGNVELVSNSYAGGMVEGIWVVGGLVGLNQSGLHPSSGLIVNTYAGGNVSGSYNVGGLVGENRMRVENSYASGAVSGYSFVGGLVGRNAGSIVAGYWDQEASGVVTSDGSPDENGLATNELQASDLFEGWSSEHWDFTTGHYPVLKYIVGDDDAHPACDDGTSTGDNTDLPSCATVLSGQLPPLVLIDDIRGVTQANEGNMYTLTVPTVSDGSANYNYTWTQTVKDSAHLSNKSALTLTGTNTAALNVVIPVDFIAADTTAVDVTFKVVVSDGISTASRITVVTINKIDNGQADINISVTSATLTVAVGTDPDGDPNPAGYTYQWQSRAFKTDSEWTDIMSATDESYAISDDAMADNQFRIQVTYTDAQDYTVILESNPYPILSRGIKIRAKVFLEGPLR